MLIFQDAETLSLDHQFEYWGDAFNYRNVANISLRGKFISNKFYDVSTDYQFGLSYVDSSGAWVPLFGVEEYVSGGGAFTSGNFFFANGLAYVAFSTDDEDLVEPDIISPVYDLFEGHFNIRERFSDFQEILLNGVSIGSGRVISYDFGKNETIDKSDYSVELEIYKDSCLDNWGGAGYENVTFPNDTLRFINSLNENFNINKNIDGSLDFNRSLSFDLISGDNRNSLEDAKNLASGMLWGDPLFAAAFPQYPSFYQEGGFRKFQESYDLFNGKYSFSEDFKTKNNQEYVWNYGLSLDISEGGISSISENGTIVGVGTNKFTSAQAGFVNVKNSQDDRISEFYNFYYSGCDIQPVLLNTNTTYDKCLGEISYVFNYTDDPNSSGCFIVDKDLSIARAQNGAYSLSERGVVRSRCGDSPEEKLSGAIGYFKTNISGSIEDELWELYSGETSGCPCETYASGGGLILDQYGHDYNRIQGSFGFNYSYKVDCSSISDNCFIGQSLITVDKPVHKVSLQTMPYEGELAQRQNTSMMYAQSQEITVIGKCNSPIEDYFNYATGMISPPTGTFYLENINYGLTPDLSNFTMSLNYQIQGYREYNDYYV